MTPHRYALVIEKTPDGFSAFSPDVDGCVAVGETEAETRENFQQALQFHFETMQELGLEIPLPNSTVDYVDVAA